MLAKFRSFLSKCIRVWHVLKKPSTTEFKKVSKVSALGILAIGFLGFLISFLMNIFK